jgi:hypothetical protein
MLLVRRIEPGRRGIAALPGSVIAAGTRRMFSELDIIVNDTTERVTRDH